MSVQQDFLVGPLILPLCSLFAPLRAPQTHSMPRLHFSILNDRADLIISCDQDLLTLNSIKEIAFVMPSASIRIVMSQGKAI